MSKIIEKIVSNYLNKRNLITVPSDWQKEYVKLAGDKVNSGRAIEKIVKEYNDLLEDFYNRHTAKELREVLESDGQKIKSGLDKDTLVKMAVDEYSMIYKK